MTQAQAILEANDWLGGIGDQTFLAASHAEVMRDVARETLIFRQWRTIQGVAGEAVYTLPSEVIQIETIVYFPDEIRRTDSTGLDLAAPGWSLLSGPPIQWFEDLQQKNMFQVFPVPEVDGVVEDVLNPTESFVVFSADVPTDMPDWLTGLLAMRMAAREAMRLGETQDRGVAQALTQVSTALTAILAVGLDA